MRYFFAGFIPRDKSLSVDCVYHGNFYNVYFSVASQGDICFIGCQLDTCQMAACATTDASKGIGSTFISTHIGGGPYCFYGEPTATYVDAPLLGGTMLSVSLEFYGNAVLWGDRRDGDLTAGTGTGVVTGAVWQHMGDGESVGEAAYTLAERPRTWGYRCEVVQEWLIDCPDFFLEGSTYSQGLFDCNIVHHMEIRSAETLFDALGSNKILCDDCSIDLFELRYRDQRIRVVNSAASLSANDLVEWYNQRVRACTMGAPVGVAKMGVGAALAAVPVIVEGQSVSVNTTIGSGSGVNSRLIPDSTAAGKVKVAAAATDADQVGVANYNSNGTTIPTRLKGLA